MSNEMDVLFPLPDGCRNADDMGLPTPVPSPAPFAKDAAPHGEPSAESWDELANIGLNPANVESATEDAELCHALRHINPETRFDLICRVVDQAAARIEALRKDAERAIHLFAQDDYAIVSVEDNKQWIEVIREHMGGPFSHIVEPLGIRKRLDAALSKEQKC